MNSKELEALIRPNIRSLCPYSTARDEYQGSIGVFLDANESPYNTGYNRYPDPHQKALKEKISTIKEVPAQNIFLGNGSDEAIDLVFRIFCTPGQDNAIAMSPSYGMYAVSADINDVKVRNVMLKNDFSLPVDELLAAADDSSKVMFLCSPNNPTGNAFPKKELLKVINRFKGIVVVDEAYVDFSEKGSLIDEIDNCRNLIILQTMSKARGMAGLRLGMAFSNARIIELMSMVKYPYNINQSAQKAVMEQLEQDISDQVKEIVAERERIAELLPRYSFVNKVWPSDANFLLVDTNDADSLYRHLLKDGIIVRNRNKVAMCSGCLRITIGLKDENEKMIESMDRYEKGDICR